MFCMEGVLPNAKAILQGQWISILIAGTGIFATILSNTHPTSNFPLLMNSCNYLLLSTYLFRKRLCRSKESQSLITQTDSPAISLWWYVLAAVFDVEANFLVLLAYNYTTITSVMLLDCFTIPCAMILSYVFLGCRYRARHLAGTIVCLSGLACIVTNDSLSGSDESGSNPILGDILCLSAAMLYACSNVLQERLVKFHDREQFLGYLGCFGFVIAFIQCMIFDLPAMRNAIFTWEVICSLIGFVLCLFFMYINTTTFLQQGDSVVFNLSLLTSDVYAVIFTYFFDGYLVSWLYFIAFCLVIIGVMLYHSEQEPSHVGRNERRNSCCIIIDYDGSNSSRSHNSNHYDDISIEVPVSNNNDSSASDGTTSLHNAYSRIYNYLYGTNNKDGYANFSTEHQDVIIEEEWKNNTQQYYDYTHDSATKDNSI